MTDPRFGKVKIVVFRKASHKIAVLGQKLSQRNLFLTFGIQGKWQ